MFARTVADAAYFAASLAESGTFAPRYEALSRPPEITVLPRFPWNARNPAAARHLQASLKRLADAGTELKTGRAAQRVRRKRIGCTAPSCSTREPRDAYEAATYRAS